MRVSLLGWLARHWRQMLAAIIFTGLLAFIFWPNASNSLVVYCAHDAVYADQILAAFTRESGVPVRVRYDTEATKSLGLVEMLLREKDNPRCDVFWNNELLGTVRLAEAEVLERYRGPGYDRIPVAFKDAAGYWTGFGARFRVWICNTNEVRDLAATFTDHAAVEPALTDDLSRVAIAKPLYGTTRTHYTVLWKAWGPERLKAWHHRWQQQGVKMVAGNATVKNLVGEGVCHWGLTDSDDFFVGRDESKPVAMIPYRVDGRATICIPNTVAIIRGTRRSTNAQRLVDYLLSEQAEVALANSTSRQVPLGAVDAAHLPLDVQRMRAWVNDAYPLSQLGDAPRACLDWLKTELLPQ